MSTITNIQARAIVDSRNNPTLEVTVELDTNYTGSFKVPSGASTGIHEAYELRDGSGSVDPAIHNINEIIKPLLLGRDAYQQQELDELLITKDGTKQKKILGGNAMIGVSIAIAKAQASADGLEFWEYLRTKYNVTKQSIPKLYINLSGGGKHAPKGPAFQEYHIIPQVNEVSEALSITRAIWKSFTKRAHETFGEDLSVGDEGGISIPSYDVTAPLVLLNESIHEHGYENKVTLSLDVAASSFFDNGRYHMNNRNYSPSELLDYYKELVRTFPLSSIEDPFHEEDFESFSQLKAQCPEVDIIGDDLTVTNAELLTKAINVEAIDGLIIKPNQIGTLTETIATITQAHQQGLKTIVSHRSGETDDSSIADIAYGLGCYGLKAGDPEIPVRAVKYQRLSAITQ
jgi:enolase